MMAINERVNARANKGRGEARPLNGAHPKLERILSYMEPGVDYTAAELAVISKSSRNEVGGQLRKAVADERVKIVGVATTGWRCGTGFIYRINKEE